MKVLKDDLALFGRHDVRLRVVGSRAELKPKLVEAIEQAERATEDNKSGTLLLCLNYGGHSEIVDAVKQAIGSGVAVEDLSEEVIESNLYASDVPACDLIVRTSGEQRLSNFMLWRSAYSELLFLDKQWPEMDKGDVVPILEEYARRHRRFGG